MSKWRIKRLLRKANKRGIYIYGCDKKFKVMSFYKDSGFHLLITNPTKHMKTHPEERIIPVIDFKYQWAFKPF